MKKTTDISFLPLALICGAATGLVIFLFKLAARYVEELSRFLFTAAKQSVLYIIFTLILCLFASILMGYLHKKAPEAKGGGIPRSEGILRGLLPFRYLRTLLGTFIGSLLSFLFGIPVGSEGPAVLIGTCLGKMFSKFKRNDLAIDRFIMTGGAGAGFAVATGAPLSAMLFSLEEIHKRFTPLLAVTVSISVLASTLVNKILCRVFGISAVLFDFDLDGSFTLSLIPQLVLAGVLAAAFVALFDWSIGVFKRFSSYTREKIPTHFRLSTVFLLAGILALILPSAVYSGHHMITELLEGTGLYMALALLAIRLFMMLLITDCGITGGIFIPTLAIGALCGTLTVRILSLLSLPEPLFDATVLIVMCAFLGGTMRAPFTACILYLELTGSFTDLFYVALVVFTVNLITELIANVPFYDRVLHHTVKKEMGTKKRVEIFREFTVEEGSFVCNKTVRDVMWPYFCVVMNIKHGSERNDAYFNDGEKHLYPGDIISVRIRVLDEENSEEVKVLTALTKAKA